MKTLNEVIKALEICSQMDAECDKCPYKSTAKGWCEEKDRDALHYLKAYKDDRNDLTALRAFWKEQYENQLLSWDELKQMEGKPVWVEDEDSYSRWEIINGVYDDGISFGDYYLNKNEFGTVWQAYRKERK